MSSQNVATGDRHDHSDGWGSVPGQQELPAGPYGAADEHLAWAKQRALEYLDAGDVANAVASWMSDLRKHPNLADHASIELIGMHTLAGLLTEATARELIEGSR